MIYVESHGDDVVLRVAHDLDEETLPEFDALIASQSIRPFTQLSINLVECGYINSAAISRFVRLWRTFPNSFEVVVPPNGSAYTVLDLCGFLAEKTFVRVDTFKPDQAA